MSTREQEARILAVRLLRRAQGYTNSAVQTLYRDSPGYAGEVESVNETINIAISVLKGEPVE